LVRAGRTKVTAEFHVPADHLAPTDSQALRDRATADFLDMLQVVREHFGLPDLPPLPPLELLPADLPDTADTSEDEELTDEDLAQALADQTGITLEQARRLLDL
jgi:hypothetical protein